MGFFDEKAVDVIEEVMENKGIEPGELNERIGKVLDLIEEFEPTVRQIGELSEDMNEDVEQLREDIESLETTIDDFSGESNEMADAMNNLAESMDKFADLMEDVEE